jgi:GntR family transcriptional regulator, rspAB operon transcriptional repressor
LHKECGNGLRGLTGNLLNVFKEDFEMTISPHRFTPDRTEPDKTQEKIADILSAASIDPSLSYTDQLFVILRDTIIQGRFLPGMTLSEAAISSAVGVSRTPAREALRMLALKNLVVIYPQAGTVVAPVRMSLLSESKFIRCALESENASELALSISPQQLDELQEILKLQEQSIANRQGDLIHKYDDAMHRRLFEFTNRVNVWELIETAKVHMDRVRYLLIVRVADHSARALKEHKEIYSHLANHDPVGVSNTIHNHINQVMQDITDLKRNSTENFFID